MKRLEKNLSKFRYKKKLCVLPMGGNQVSQPLQT